MTEKTKKKIEVAKKYKVGGKNPTGGIVDPIQSPHRGVPHTTVEVIYPRTGEHHKVEYEQGAGLVGGCDWVESEAPGRTLWFTLGMLWVGLLGLILWAIFRY